MAQIIREPETARFTILANGVLRDSRLTFRATGVLARLLSEPPDSAINTSVLWRERRPHGEGRDALLTALRELEHAGYLVRTRRQDDRGRWRTDWIVRSVPVGTDPAATPTWVWPSRDVDHTPVASSKDRPDAPPLATACG